MLAAAYSFACSVVYSSDFGTAVESFAEAWIASWTVVGYFLEASSHQVVPSCSAVKPSEVVAYHSSGNFAFAAAPLLID